MIDDSLKMQGVGENIINKERLEIENNNNVLWVSNLVGHDYWCENCNGRKNFNRF